MSFNNVRFDLKARTFTLVNEYDYKRNETHDLKKCVSRMTYLQDEKFCIDIIIKDFVSPVRSVKYSNESIRDEDAARFVLIFDGHF